jgi:hypothetical protein
MNLTEANMMRTALHPLYSRNPAPSDFGPFGDMKGRLSGCSFDNDDQLFGAISEILSIFEAETLNRVFREWMKRLQQSRSTEREYVRWDK